ncbi:hypothetical protein DMC47_38415 [Nostoc sp. 3335mG]|nr:hypothetical protein DMC47_38415 [Nostoc sp. 3335mG]
MMVEIRAGGSLLWAGPMRVAERSSAMFNQQKNDAPRTECTLDQPEYFGVARSSLSVNLSVVRYGANASGYQIRVSWEHPAADSGCDGERSTRSVGIQQSFQLEPGRETSISGDGGLAVTIRRR